MTVRSGSPDGRAVHWPRRATHLKDRHPRVNFRLLCFPGATYERPPVRLGQSRANPRSAANIVLRAVLWILPVVVQSDAGVLANELHESGQSQAMGLGIGVHVRGRDPEFLGRRVAQVFEHVVERQRQSITFGPHESM
jgi:hypothetical protein